MLMVLFPWFSTWGQFYPRGLFYFHDKGHGFASGIRWVEAMDGDKHPKMHKTAPTTKKYLTPNVNSAQIEKSCLVP